MKKTKYTPNITALKISTTPPMSNVNYIAHLNAFFMKIAKDTRLNPTHISLYMALFKYWNSYRFPNDFIIIRDEVMKLSKIGSKSTYHRCLKQLDTWNYIRYKPSHNSFKEIGRASCRERV